jgi:hypothetical protein
MNKIVFTLVTCFLLTTAFAQKITTTKADKNKDIIERAGDHIMLQISSDHLANMPDSISSHQTGFSRGFNAYVMFDKPFRGSPKYSFAIGLGMSSSNITFKKMGVDIKSNTTTNLPFTALDSTSHFKKYKLAFSYLELPIEFRFSSNPSHNAKSIKFALGGKIGTVLDVHTKGKTLQDKNNATINNYSEKENSRRFFNSTRLSGTVRVGYGIFSVFGSYSFSNLLKDGVGAPMKVFQVGLTLSGL